MGELGARVASAAVLAPIALAAIWFGGAAFAVLVLLIAVLAFWEWTSITGVSPYWMRAGGIALLVVGLVAVEVRLADWAIALLGLPVLIGLAAGYFYRDSRWWALGLVYVAAPTAGMILLRAPAETGRTAILFIFLVVWTSDIAAYFGGRSMGGPKLWPRVSPKKTWSGALSGLFGAALVGAVLPWVIGSGAIALGFVLAAALSVATQAGDLLESALKRWFGAKDSGRIIPGHGGVLDRIDGLYGAAMLAFIIAAVRLGGPILSLPGEAQ